jgi:hypothetical protein
MLFQQGDLFTHVLRVGRAAANGGPMGWWPKGVNFKWGGGGGGLQVLQVEGKDFHVVMHYLVVVLGILGG